MTIPGTDLSLSSDPTDANQDASNGAEDRVTEADLIPAGVKSTMVLESAKDIHALERDLRKVENYKERGVDGAGELEGASLIGRTAQTTGRPVIGDISSGRLTVQTCSSCPRNSIAWRRKAEQEVSKRIALGGMWGMS